MISEAVTAQDISCVFGISDRTVHRRAKAEGWLYVMAAGVKKYYTCSMTRNDRLALIGHQKNEKLPLPVQINLPALPKADVSICEKQMSKGMAKADLLRCYTAWQEQAPWGKKKKHRKTFMSAYNSGIAYPDIYKIIGKVSWKTIEGWKTLVKKNSGETLVLADHRGYVLRGKSKMTDAEKDIILACALHSNQLLIAEAIRSARDIMEIRGIPAYLSDATYTRYLKDWQSKHIHIWTFQREGESAWNDKCCIDIERDPNSINVGDVLVADGHTLNFDILNPWTGKPKRMTLVLWYDMRSSFPLGWEIMPTEDTAAISSSLRRAIIRLGKIPKVVYLDNGKAFRAKYFTQTADFAQAGLAGLYERLGIQAVFAWAYHGQSKTIERFFGTMSEMERRTITYTGTSIEKKPPRMKRGEHLHRKAYEKITQGGCITLEQAHISIATWFDKYISRKQKGKWLKNQTPLDLFLPGKGPGVDPYELRYLMMSITIKKIHKNGVTILGQNYYSPELYGRNHKAIIRFDLQDKTAIDISDENDEFICAAEPKKLVHAMARLGTDEDQNELKKQIEHKRHQGKLAGASTREFLETTILPEHRAQLAQMEPSFAKATQGKPGFKGQVKKIDFSGELTDAEKKKIQRDYDELIEMNKDMPGEEPKEEYVPETITETAMVFKSLPKMDEIDRYEKLIELDVRNILIPKEHRAFMTYYEQTGEYKMYGDRFEEHRARTVMVWQLENEAEAVQ